MWLGIILSFIGFVLAIYSILSVERFDAADPMNTMEYCTNVCDRMETYLLEIEVSGKNEVSCHCGTVDVE